VKKTMRRADTTTTVRFISADPVVSGVRNCDRCQ
jgi:hypothetical protein